MKKRNFQKKANMLVSYQKKDAHPSFGMTLTQATRDRFV